jgi:hypothetical protein
LGALNERVENEEDGDFVAADGGGTTESGGGEAETDEDGDTTYRRVWSGRHRESNGKKKRRTENEVGDVSVVSVGSTTPARSGDVTRSIDSYTVRRKRRVKVGGGSVGEAKKGGRGSVDSFRVVEELTEEEVACGRKGA